MDANAPPGPRRSTRKAVAKDALQGGKTVNDRAAVYLLLIPTSPRRFTAVGAGVTSAN